MIQTEKKKSVETIYFKNYLWTTKIDINISVLSLTSHKLRAKSQPRGIIKTSQKPTKTKLPKPINLFDYLQKSFRVSN